MIRSSSEFFRENDTIQQLYDQSRDLERAEPGYPEASQTVKRAAYDFFQYILENTWEDEDVYLAWQRLSYVRRCLDRLQKKEEWISHVEEDENRKLASQFDEAMTALEPFITQLEEYIHYGQIAGNDTFYVVMHPLAHYHPFWIAWKTYHPERDPDGQGDPYEVIDGGFIPDRGREPREFETMKEGGEYLRETYQQWATTPE